MARLSRGVLLSFLLLFVASALPLPLLGQDTPPIRYYSVTDLGPGDAFRIRNLGLGVTAGALELGLCPAPSGSRTGFFWNGQNGFYTPLCPLPEDATAEAYDFEQLGFWSAVGVSRDAAGTDHPTIWAQQSDGSFLPKLLRLPTGGSGGVAWGTVSSGLIVGEVGVSGERRAAFWLIPSFAPTVFPLSGDSAAFSIAGSTTDPVTAGQHLGRFTLWYPRRSQDNVVYPLGETPSTGYRLFSSSGVITAVGQLATAGGTGAFLWFSDFGVTELPGLGGGQGAARDMHPGSGRIVGFSSGLGGGESAVLWEDGLPWDLNELILPTCREGLDSLCDPWRLEIATSIGDPGTIVGSGTLNGQAHAFLAKPVELLTWGMATCAETVQPLCVADPLQNSQELIIDPVKIESSTPLSSSAAEPYSAAAKASQLNDGLALTNAAAKFRAFAVFEHGTVIAHLPPGQTQLEVLFHFETDHQASTSGTETLASADASLALRASRNVGTYSSANGSISVQNGAVSRHGFLAGQGSGGGKVSLPLQLKPFATDGLEVRIEGSTGASALASGVPTSAEAEISVFFCAEDPRSITLADGTPLAELGIKYTLWPTVKGDDRCQNPLEDQETTSASCPGGGLPAGPSSLRVVAPAGILPGESVEIEAIADPAGGTIGAVVASGNGTVERAGPCITYPDGEAHCAVKVRAASTLPPEGVVVVRLTYTHPDGCFAERNVSLLASRLELVDPIVGDAARLVDRETPLTAQPAEFIRRDPALLARLGRRVRGLAADGVTPVILRFRAPGPGSVTFTLTDDRGSRDPARAGRLADLLATPAVTANPVTVPVQQVGDEHWAFAVLTSPIDFVRPDVPGDAALGQARPRVLEITGAFAPADGGTGLTVLRKADLVRPPVTLIHGIWSEGATWKWDLQKDDRFFTYPHDYKAHAGRSFLENQSQAWWGVRNTLMTFRDEKNIAATQVDVFGHSMGGILARIYAGGRAYAENRGQPHFAALAREYRESGNFGAGTIHKLVIIDSPQLGSPHASLLMNPIRMWLVSWIEPRVFDGAVPDLRRGEAGIQALPVVTLPVHAMIGAGGGEFIRSQVVSSGVTSLPGSPGWIGKLVAFVTPSLIDQHFAPEPDHDVIVGVCSQRAGLPEGSAAAVVTTDIVQSMHTNNTSSGSYSQKAVDLLNRPVADPAFAPGLLPPTPFIDICAPQNVVPTMEEVLFASPTSANATGSVEVVEGALVVSDPAPETSITAGSTFSVSVTGSAGFTPVRIFIDYGTTTFAVDGSSFTGVLDMPEDAAGDIELVATAEDATGRVSAATPIPLHVIVPAALTGLAMPAPVVLTAATPTGSIPVFGTFDDGIERDLSDGSTGTLYLSADPTVATVDEDGAVTAVRAGSTVVHVTHETIATLVEVEVLSTPGDFDGDGSVGIADFLELRACWTGPGEDPEFTPPPNACRDSFDFDGDADVDRADYDGFLARYDGPANDCNGNLELDLTDIVDGVSADTDADAVPDECQGS